MNKTVNQNMINSKISQDMDILPIHKVKFLLPKLKESLSVILIIWYILHIIINTYSIYYSFL